MTKSHISVCICTYKRSHFLSPLIKSVDSQATEDLFTFDIIVVDNDWQRTAQKIVSLCKRECKTKITYAVEERQNISLARNKAIQYAKGDLIAFIDDDEIPDKFWLVTLYKAMGKYKADAVMGPVLPIYQVKPPEWVIKGKFFQRPTYKTGFINDWTKGRTGNLLIKKSLFDYTGINFDPRFGKGGEDQDLARRMMRSGFKFVWCNEAIAHEIIPPARWRLKNMIRKAFTRGKMSAQYPGSRFIMASKSIIAASVYALSLPFLLILDYALFIEYLVKISDHSGRIIAIILKSRIQENE
ncbi:MAG TPA: glycosyltransferase [Candidatus Saccharicenans sp.]|nr:glycosyltransferase [Candidatus Saccharicenans sp.]HPD03608.1 glycosyltransferase [bacterium]